MDYWNELSLMEQLSNIGGEVKHLVYARERFLSSETKDDHYNEYISLITKLIQQTIDDPKIRISILRKNYGMNWKKSNAIIMARLTKTTFYGIGMYIQEQSVRKQHCNFIKKAFRKQFRKAFLQIAITVEISADLP